MSAMDREKLGELLSAYLDDELSSREIAAVRRILDKDEDARRLLLELRSTIELVSALPRHRAPSSIATDVQSHVERSELLADVTQTAPVSSAGRGPMRAILSMAAALVFVVGGAWFVSSGGRWGVAPSSEQVALVPFEEEAGIPEVVREEERERAGAPAPAASARRSTSRGRGGGTKTAAKPADLRESEHEAGDSAKGAGDSATRTLVATADIESKLAVGMGVSSVHRHAFDNESVRLRVSVRNAAERDEAMGRLTAFLQSRSAVNLGARTESIAEQSVPARGFYYRGDPSVNFADSRQRQVLVRTSPRDLGRMVSELSSTVGSEDAFVLTSGPLTVRGARRVKFAVSGLGEAPGSPKDGSLRKLAKLDESADRGSADNTDLLAELANTFNLDPSVFSAGRDAISMGRSGALARAGSEEADSSNEKDLAMPTVVEATVADETHADANAGIDSDDLKPTGGAAPGELYSKLERRPTLVERRRERLERLGRLRKAESIPGDSGGGVAKKSKSSLHFEAESPEPTEPEGPQERDEVYVTLVVEFVINGPVTGKTKAKARAKRPSKTRNKSPEPNTPQ